MISIWNHLPNASFVFSQNCHRLLGLTLRRHYETEKAPKHVKIWNCHLFWPFWLSKSLNLDRIFKRVFCCARNFWHSLWGIESIQKVTCEGWDNDFWRFFVVPGTKSGKVREMRAQLELIGIVRIVQVISVWVTGCLRCLRRWLRHRWLAVLAGLAALAMLPVSSSGLNLVNIFQLRQLIWHPFCLTTHLTTLPIFFYLFFFSSMCSPCFACIYFTSNFEKWHARISMHFWVQLLTHCIELWKFNVLKLKQVWYFDVFFTSFFASLLLLCKGSMETANESPLAGTLQISSDVLLEEFHLESFLTISLKRRNETWNLPWCCAFGHFSFSGRTGKSLSVLTCSSKGGTDGWLQPQPQAWPVWLEAGVSCQTQLEWNSLLSNCQTPKKNHSCFRIKSN